MLETKTGVIFDGNNYLYRSFYALKYRMGGTDSITTGILGYSFLNQIHAFMKKQGFDHFPFIIWDDEDARAVRKAIFQDYKGNRDAVPSVVSVTRDILMEQLGNIKPRLCLSYPGLEADDVMHILAKHADVNIDKWIVCTRDVDLIQCISSTVIIYDPHTKTYIDQESAKLKYGFDPLYIVVYKALVGDSADNWGGVEGIGKVTANKWIKNGPHTDPGGLFSYIFDKIGDPEKYKQFVQGISLCLLPIIDDVSPVVKYLEDRVSASGISDWSEIHNILSIRDKEKARFYVGNL